MLDNKTLMNIATTKLIEVFGKEYLKVNYPNTCIAHGIIDDKNTYMLFVGIKGSKDLPKRKATEKGWVVYGKVLVDANTGKVIDLEYALE